MANPLHVRAARRPAVASPTTPPGRPRPTIALPRVLPTVRSVVGAMLCVAAALVAWFSATATNPTAPIPVVVAARPIPAGAIVRPDDVRVTALALPVELERRTFRSPEAVLGAITVGPTQVGDPVLPGTLAPGGPLAGRRLISLLLPTAAAVGGQLRSGDVVDVLATRDKDGDEPSRTETIASKVVISDIEQPGSGVTTTSTERLVTFALDETVDPIRFVHAAATAKVHLVRVTGALAASTNRP